MIRVKKMLRFISRESVNLKENDDYFPDFWEAGESNLVLNNKRTIVALRFMLGETE